MIFQNPWWLIPLFLLFSAALSALLYYRERSLLNVRPWQLSLLMALRFITVFIILVLLFAPLIRTTKKIIDKPVIVFAHDNSESVLINSDSLYYKGEYKRNLLSMVQRLSYDYKVVFYNFGEAVRIDSIPDFTDNLTNISEVFPVLSASYAGMNLGAVVLCSDGVYNLGQNPLYAAKPNTTIYTLALGDTAAVRDVLIRQVQHNRAAFFKNRFPVRVEIAARNCQGESTKLKIMQGENIVFEKQIVITNNDFQTAAEAEIEASPKGLQQFEIVLEPVSGEITLANNRQIFVVNVVDNRRNILILANAPHPDLGCIITALKNNPDYQVSLAFASSFSGDIQPYQMVVLHQLPSVDNPATHVLTKLSKQNIPVLHILGSKSSIDAFNQMQSGLKIISTKNSFDEATPIMTSSFNAFTSEQAFIDLTRNLPPLLVPFGNYQFSGNAKTMMQQRVNTVNTDKPLIAFIDNGGLKNGFIAGEGIWRWRLDLYRHSGSHDLFNTFINKLMQYMISTRVQQSLIVDSKRVFNENEPVLLEAEFYNDAFELTNLSDLAITISDESGKEIKRQFKRTNDYYTINIGSLSPGKYLYAAALEFDGKSYTASGEFIVIDVNLEALSTVANHALMYNLANESGGEMCYANELSKLENSIRNNKNIVSSYIIQVKLSNLIDLKWLFFVVLFLAALEWFLRKYWGSY